MAIARSRITAQGQISVPLDVRRRLGAGPGSTIEWEDEDGRIVVRRATQFTSEEIHQAVFPGQKPSPQSLGELKEGIRRSIRKRHALD